VTIPAFPLSMSKFFLRRLTLRVLIYSDMSFVVCSPDCAENISFKSESDFTYFAGLSESVKIRAMKSFRWRLPEAFTDFMSLPVS
jgi:hypothetical protein